jgi:phage pi2 protein 07
MELTDLFRNSSEGDDDVKGGTKSPLQSLKVDLDFYSESIKEISTEMIAEGYTLYPIFIAHQHEVSLGELILDKSELGTNWSINASSMEEFIDRGVIKEGKQAAFEKNYKKAEDFMCLFVVVPEGANFVFYPFK